MLNPTSRSDRLNYGSIILPDVGYHLEKAVGTTYSLDLETLIAIAIKVGLIQDSGEDLLNDMTGMLAALNKVSDKMVVFCEAGHIKKTPNAKPLFLLLEKIVVPVAIKRKNKTGSYASFHPKSWLLQYADNAGNYKYRLIVLSRNLTFDHSWDIAVSFSSRDRKIGDKNTERIQYFLDFLADKIDSNSKYSDNQAALVSQLKDDLDKVSFEVDSDLFDSFEFLPLGIGQNSASVTKQFFESTNSSLFVISPFLSKGIIKKLSDNCNTYDLTLITRKTELQKIADGKGYDFDVYVIRDDVVNGESGLSEFNSSEEDSSETESVGELDYRLQDIHAKMYFMSKGQKSHLYLGSANASDNAIYSNVETLVCLHSRGNAIDSNMIFQDVIGNESRKDCPFEKVDFELDYSGSDDDDVTDELETTIKEICRLKKTASVKPQKDGLYSITVTFEEYSSPYNISIIPFLCKVPCELSSSIVFENFTLVNLSEFYILSVSSGKNAVERIITIPTEGIPDIRDREIVKSVIRNQRQFIEYISFLLDEDYLKALYEKRELQSSGFYKKANMMPAVYEKMLRSAFDSPEKIRDIQGVLKMLDEDEELVPPEFIEMYKTFCIVLGIDPEGEK